MLLLLSFPLSSHHKHRDAPVKLRQASKKERPTIHLIWKGEEAGDHDSGPFLNQIPFSPMKISAPVNESPANNVSNRT